VLAAVVDALEAQHITTLYTVETSELIEPVIRSPVNGISAVTHNVLLLRHVEENRELHKVISILKLRDSGFDRRLREFHITEAGIVMDGAAPLTRPARREPESVRSQRPPASVAFPGPDWERPPYVVIVDDEFGLAELISEVLAEKGYSTAIAINGQLGLALLRERRPDLVLLDLMMPVLNGTEVMREMKADPLLSGVPVVLMTALPEAVPANEGLAYEAVLQKPFTPERLFEVVRAGVGQGT
jgi:CheY-like chemotaxis protein